MLQVTHLVFNEGYAASSAGVADPPRPQQRSRPGSGRLIVELLPDREAPSGFSPSCSSRNRRDARASSTGDMHVLLEDQDRSLWNQAQIREGESQLMRALATKRPVGRYTIQAAIAADPCRRWRTRLQRTRHQIVELYNALLRIEPSPIVALNRAVAVAMRDGPEAGLDLLDDILADGDLADYHLAHAARSRFVPPAGKNGRCPRLLRTGIGFGKTGNRTPFPSAGTPPGTELREKNFVPVSIRDPPERLSSRSGNRRRLIPKEMTLKYMLAHLFRRERLDRRGSASNVSRSPAGVDT